MKRNHKFSLFALIVLALIVVVSSVSISLVLSDRMKETGSLLKRLRVAMGGSGLGFEKLFAYIVPSDDAHQVSDTFLE